jgi:hypothetical protein
LLDFLPVWVVRGLVGEICLLCRVFRLSQKLEV